MAPFHAPNTAQECISRNLMVFIDRIFCVVECVTEAFIHGKHLVEKRALFVITLFIILSGIWILNGKIYLMCKIFSWHKKLTAQKLVKRDDEFLSRRILCQLKNLHKYKILCSNDMNIMSDP